MKTADSIKLVNLVEMTKNMGLAVRDVRNLAAQATRYVAKRAVDRIKKAAPKDTGTMAKAFKPASRKKWTNTFRADITVNMGSSKEDPAGAWYWHFPDKGTKMQARQNFFDPAIRATDKEAKGVFEEQVMKRAIRMMKRRAKK